MLAPKRALQLLFVAVLILGLTAPTLAQTPAPTRTVTPAPQPTPAPTQEATMATPSANAAPGAVQLTVYNQNLGLVRQVHEASLLDGLSVFRVTNVPAQIIPGSVHIGSLTAPDSLTVLEQQYDYDVVSAGSLLGRYVDQTITVIPRDGQPITGVLLGADEDIVLETEYGIEIMRRDQVQHISLPPMASRPATRPSLAWLLNADTAEDHALQLTYLTGGISWQADYVALLTDDDTEMDLEARISINNQSGVGFENARLKLVAGEINRVEAPVFAETEAMFRAMDMAAAMPVQERGILDYHLYDVSRPITIRDRQVKQVEFARANDVSVEKRYVLEMTPPIYVRLGSAVRDAGFGVPEEGAVAVQVWLDNSQASGLGVPLPQGTVRVYKEDVDGSAILVGEDTVAHTPRDEQIRLSLGRAFDLVGERRQTSFRQLGERSLEETVEVTLRNQSDSAVTIQVIEHLYRAHDAEVTESSRTYEELDANTIRYAIPVGSGDTETVTYTVVYRW